VCILCVPSTIVTSHLITTSHIWLTWQSFQKLMMYTFSEGKRPYFVPMQNKWHTCCLGYHEQVLSSYCSSKHKFHGLKPATDSCFARICLLLTHTNIGGGSAHSLYFVQGFNRKGHTGSSIAWVQDAYSLIFIYDCLISQ
jgi:hypothetical protein